jgi:tetratricopeptide (TPR) repeat protein
MDRALAEMDRGRRVGGADLVEPARIDGLVALFSGQFDLARERLEAVSRHSSRAIGDTYLALASYYSGDAARGRRMLEQLTAEPSASTATRSRAALAGVLAALGESAEARTHLDRVLASEYRDHHVSYGIGVAFAQLGEADQAIKWLHEAVDTGFPCVTWYLHDPLLDPVRKSPAFEALIADLTSRRDAAVSRYTER